jgi:multisubunit Na+/H+ antiporter MnhF subunit
MTTVVGVVVCVALAATMLAGLFRLVVGPRVADRILGFDMLTVSAAGMMAVLSLVWHTSLFLELILIFTMLGFMGTVALVGYLQRPDKDLADPCGKEDRL